jgi:hypothetical protein
MLSHKIKGLRVSQSAFKYSITSVLYKPFTVSAKAISYESPVVPTDARKFAASKR